jgi:hypothetical protein
VEVAQGKVKDRPFARTVYSIAAQRFTGDLVMRDGERRYKTSWEDGRIVAAESSAPADSPGRVALSAGLVTSSHVSAAIDAMARAPGGDQLQILSELARLKPDQVAALKRRLLAQRAARAFALPDAVYVLDNARSLRADPEVPPLDARWLVYYGVRMHYTVERLEREMGALLDRGFRLADDAATALPAFAFGEGERAVMDRLSQHAWTPRQLLGACVGVEGRLVLSVLYALVACDCLEAGSVPPPSVIARGTETEGTPIEAASSTDPAAPLPDAPAPEGSGRRRSAPSTSPAPPAVPAAGTQARLAHGTVRRLLFPGQGTSPPPTQEASARARRASARPQFESEGEGEGWSGIPGVSRGGTIPPAPSDTNTKSTPSRTTGTTSAPGTTRPPPGTPSSTIPPDPSGPRITRRAPSSQPPPRRNAGSEPPVGGGTSTLPPASRTRTTSPIPIRGGNTAPPGTPPSTSRTRTTNPPPLRDPTTPPPSRPHSTTVPPALRRGNPTSMPPSMGRAAAAEIRKMIADKIDSMERGVDHYSILGVTQGAKSDEIRAAYFAIAKRIHPDRLRAVGVTDVDHDAQRLFARINQAFGVLSDPGKRNEYSVVMSAGGEQVVRKAQAAAEEKAGQVLRAEETFRRGEMALRRSMFEQARALFEEAVELNGEEAEYHALLAWATWLVAPNKSQVSEQVQKGLAHALALSPQCVPAHFYVGQIAKNTGQTQIAIDAFRIVIDLEPGHPEANLELRVLRGRLKKK